MSENEAGMYKVAFVCALIAWIVFIAANYSYYAHQNYLMVTNGYTLRSLPGQSSPQWIKEAK